MKVKCQLCRKTLHEVELSDDFDPELEAPFCDNWGMGFELDPVQARQIQTYVEGLKALADRNNPIKAIQVRLRYEGIVRDLEEEE